MTAGALTTTQVHVHHASAVHAAARAARRVATSVGLPAPMPDQAAVIASELASNLDKHAGGGSVFIQPLLTGGGLDIVAADSGPGMADVARCLVDGHTTTGSLGAGLGAVRRMASRFDIHSVVPHGTLVSARLTAPGADVTADGIACLCLPADGEQVSGDGVALHATPTSTTILVADGLGHGVHAAEATHEAIRVFHSDPTRPLPEQLTAMHRDLRATRGAAVALTRISGGNMEFCGVGNVSATVTSGNARRSMLSRPGIVGANIPTPRTQAAPLPHNGTVIVHTDGLRSQWTASLAVPTRELPPALLAASLVQQHRRLHDDTTVMVMNTGEVPR